MRREILFRGKRKDNGEWIAGYFVKGKWYLDGKESYALLPLELYLYPHCEISEWIDVDPETVCQLTGLEDKNGMNICEEDFVKIDNEWIGRVVWSPTEAAFIVFPNDDIEHETYCLGYYVYEHEIEIIGNYFDHPELLEGGERN